MPALAVASEPLAVLARQGNGRAPTEFDAGLSTQVRREFGPASVVERHERAVEGGIPERREEEAVVDVEAFGVALALGPGFAPGSSLISHAQVL
jgi:hypothetical protein